MKTRGPVTDIIVREANYADIRKVIETIPTDKRSELMDYLKKYYKDDGSRKFVRTGFPDTVLVAIRGDEIVGYLHFYTDCWDGYEKVLVAVSTTPGLSYAESEIARCALEEEFRMREP